jgi:hypothetical protein
MDSASTAAMNGVNQLSVSAGMSRGRAFHTNSSWTSVGMARKIQT